MTLIECVSLSKIYSNSAEEIRALDNVNLEIKENEFLSIVGSSGSGKSTLLNIMGGLDYPTEGSVSIRGINLTWLSSDELAVFRRKNIGFIFQNYNLIPILNTYENIVLPLNLDNAEIDNNFIHEITVALDLDQRLTQMPENLSGGQQQRVAIARALATRPAIILADEPTGNLDSKNSSNIISLMREMAKNFRQTMAIITHNQDIAKMADRIVQIEDGKATAMEIV